MAASGQVNIEVAMLKVCFECKKEKDKNEFYKNNRMPSGYVNKCRECTKKSVAKHRLNNLDKIRAYDRERGNRQSSDYLKDCRRKFPNKYRATTMVNNATRSGKLFMEPCEVCGAKKTVGHHDDYLKPLNVRWLCQAHHKQWHAKNGEGLNG